MMIHQKIETLIESLIPLEDFLLSFNPSYFGSRQPKFSVWYQDNKEELKPFIEYDDICGFIQNGKHPFIQLLEPLKEAFLAYPFINPQLVTNPTEIALKKWLTSRLEELLIKDSHSLLVANDKNGLLSHWLFESKEIDVESIANLTSHLALCEFCDLVNRIPLSENWSYKSYCYDSIYLEISETTLSTISSLGKLVTHTSDFTDIIEIRLKSLTENCKIDLKPELHIGHYILSDHKPKELQLENYETISQLLCPKETYYLVARTKRIA
jgi:hypothetical protein